MMDIQAFRGELEAMIPDILACWTSDSYDAELGAFHTLGCDYRPLADGTHSAVLTARVLWSYSAAYRCTGREEYRRMADLAFADLRGHYADPVHGGVFNTLDAGLRPLDTGKKTYTQAYAVYAAGEYYRVSRDEAALAFARDIFARIEGALHAPDGRAYRSACTWDWEPVEGDLELDPHLHVLEAYAGLRRVWPGEELTRALAGVSDTVMDRFLRRNGALYQVLRPDWSEAADTSDRFADDAEAVWMLTEAAAAAGDEALTGRVRRAAALLAENVLKNGVDRLHGGVWDRQYPDGSYSGEKMWWEEVESMTGLLYAWRQTGAEAYFTAAAETWRFAMEHFYRPQGRWAWKTRADGGAMEFPDPAVRQVCPYHTMTALTYSIGCLSGV